jgi:hypothetical protein
MFAVVAPHTHQARITTRAALSLLTTHNYNTIITTWVAQEAVQAVPLVLQVGSTSSPLRSLQKYTIAPHFLLFSHENSIAKNQGLQKTSYYFNSDRSTALIISLRKYHH